MRHNKTKAKCCPFCGRCIIYDCDKIACQAQKRADGKEVSFKENKEATDD